MKQKDKFSLNPRSCVDLPQQQETLQLYIPSSGKYVPATVSQVDESKCQFRAVPIDAGRSVYQTQKVTVPRMFRVIDYVLVFSLFIFFGPVFYFLGLVLFLLLEIALRTLQNGVINAPYNKQMENFKLYPEPSASSSTATIPPRSGVFKGTSTDYCTIGDDVVQEVNTTFDFQNDGTIVGSGFDSEDGKYVVEGNWKLSPKGSEYVFLWEETYSRYSVTVVGFMPQKPTKGAEAYSIIYGRFCSSHDIPAKGTFKIELDQTCWC